MTEDSLGIKKKSDVPYAYHTDITYNSIQHKILGNAFSGLLIQGVLSGWETEAPALSTNKYISLMIYTHPYTQAQCTISTTSLTVQHNVK